MREFSDRALEADWGVGRLEATSETDLRAELSDMAGAMLRQLSGKARAKDALLRAARFVRAFSLKTTAEGEAELSLDLERALDAAPGEDIERDTVKLFTELGEAAAANRAGIVFLIDEMQLLRREDLEALCAGAHRASQDNLPLAIVGAGLPMLPERLAEAKSYAERLFIFPELGALDETAARRAIELPAASAFPDRAVRYEERAVKAILAYSERYPYFLQAFGQQAWNAAPDGDVIALGDAEEGAAVARADLDRDFFETRFARATPAGRRYLAAMAELGDGAQSSGQIAVLGGWKNSRSAGPVRQTLIDKGLIYSTDRGLVNFTVPHFADFMRRKHPLDTLLDQ